MAVVALLDLATFEKASPCLLSLSCTGVFLLLVDAAVVVVEPFVVVVCEYVCVIFSVNGQ